MPTKQPERNTQSLLPPEDGGADEYEYQRLLTYLDLASGFNLSLAICNDPSRRNKIIDRATRDAAGKGTAVRVINLGDEPEPDFTAALLREFGSDREPSRTVAMVVGLDSQVYRWINKEFVAERKRPPFLDQAVRRGLGDRP